MNKLRMAAALLLGIPLVVFGANYFVHLFALPSGDSAGARLLQAMRDGGLMGPVAFSHVVAGAALVVPRARFLGALLQLPMTLGIVSFHATMEPGGLVMAVPLLLLNLAALAEPRRLRALIDPSSARES